VKLKRTLKIILILFCFIFFVAGCNRDPSISFEEQGDRAFETKSYKLAIQYWMKSIVKDIDQGGQSGLNYKVGKAWLKLSRIDLAEQYFEQAIKADPLAYEIQKDLAKILLIQGRNTAALEKLDLLKDKLEKDADYFILYGDLFMVLNDFKKAAQMYEKAAFLNKDNIRIMIKLAMCRFQAGDINGAQKLISGINNTRNQAALAPLDLLLLSDYYFLIEDFINGETCILDALENDPDNLMLNVRLCQFYLKTDMKDKALKLLLKLEEAFPEDFRFKLMLADLFISKMEMDRAELMLAKIENVKEFQSDYNLLMGKLWLFKGKNSYAVSHLKSVIKVRPGLLSAYYLLGIAYFAGGQTKLAENSFINVLILDPNHVETLLVLSGLHYKNKEYKLALQYLEKAILLEPLNSRAYVTKGLCLMGLNKDKKASRELYKAYSIQGTISPLVFLARSLQNQGKYDSALGFYGDVIDNNPDLFDVLYRYTLLLMEMKEGEKALETVEKIIKQGYNLPVVYYIGARVCMGTGHYEKARVFLETAMEQGNVPGYIYTLSAVLYQDTGDNGQAEEILKQCTRDNPSHVKAWTDLANLYVSIGDKTRAFETLNRAVEKFPDNPLVKGNLAWLLLENGEDFDRALDLARCAYDKLPGKAWLMDTLGWAYFHKKAFSQAEWMLASAEEIAPDKGIIKYHQGMLFYNQGKLSDAKDKLETALEYDLLDKDKNQIKQVLADLDTDTIKKPFDGEIIFNPESPLSFPDTSGEEDDILEPDWSHTLKK